MHWSVLSIRGLRTGGAGVLLSLSRSVNSGFRRCDVRVTHSELSEVRGPQGQEMAATVSSLGFSGMRLGSLEE